MINFTLISYNVLIASVHVGCFCKQISNSLPNEIPSFLLLQFRSKKNINGDMMQISKEEKPEVTARTDRALAKNIKC